MTNAIPPAAVFIIGGLLIPLFKGKARALWMLFLPVAGFVLLLYTPVDTVLDCKFLDMELTLFRADRLSLLFGYIFHIISLITVIYILNFKETTEFVAGFVYAGAAIGAVFAGDLFTFFAFWELLTIGSVMLIWQRRTKAAMGAGFRYLLIHAFGGLVLLAGIVMYTQEQNSIHFGEIGLSGLSTWLIFVGLGVNCAWPLLHSWLTDAYPEATIGGTVFLSAFTTKTAVYALARAYPGAEALIWIGVAMAAFPIFYAVIENDLRRVLAYSLINQVGFMVVGIGIGTHLSINGAVAHAFNDILFKGLLFMSMGAVIHRTGKINATDLGGLYKSMPLTALFCIIGAASISAFPLFSGFVSKSMVMEAAAHDNLTGVWLVLLFASAGVFHHAGIKIPYFAFFSHDAGHRVEEAPLNMLIAMGIAAVLCVGIGSYPAPLYAILPFTDVVYKPYNYSHVMSQTQLLFFSALAFTMLLRAGIYPAEIRATNLDSDWFYRKGGRLFFAGSDLIFNGMNRLADLIFVKGMTAALCRFARRAPAHLTGLILTPFWRLTGDPQTAKKEKARMNRNFSSGTLGLGIIGLSITAYLVILFLLNV
ncbi:MAG: Na(+)/H(+) antiporter subunit D [Proteobacteria bacterium]|nr:Na(+)/H(+) antiporter subunit D [Pseudomonadota bacterium]MBU1688485.1 Na(+)/H(+) antiporter subunit D [Pseudomonadota bacterium]